MLYEYAIEPEVLTDWQALRLLVGKLGAEYGRLVALMPWNWKRIVKEGLSELSFIDRKRIVELFRRLDGTTCVANDRPFTSIEGTWLLAAEKAHEYEPFRAILARENPRAHEHVLRFEDVDETQELWHVPHTLRIKRTVEELTAAAELLLRRSSKIHFIDPYFWPGESSRTQALAAFLRIVDKGSSRAVVCRYHRLHKPGDDDCSTKEFKEICGRALADIVPPGVELRVVRWQDHRDKADGERFHDRYIATNLGALSFSYGLDIQPGSTTRVSLTSREEWRQVLQCFDPRVSPYKYIDEVVV